MVLNVLVRLSICSWVMIVKVVLVRSLELFVKTRKGVVFEFSLKNEANWW